MNGASQEVQNAISLKKDGPESGWKDWIFSCIYSPILIFQIVLVFLFYNYYGFHIISWIGWGFLGLFIIIGALPKAAFKKYGEIKDEGRFFESTKIVDKGIYGIIRHPYWLCWILLSLAFIFISQFWIIVLIGSIACAAIYLETFHLDKNLVQKFGEDYIAYKEKVPRLNLIYGLIKHAFGK
jgi:protein-S-isoprenylcysteine O-methyltransferase Ste14